MKTTLKLFAILFTIILIGCGGKEEKKKEGFSYEKKASTEQTKTTEATVPASKQVDLSNKGIGPIKSLTLDAVDQEMAAHGADVFKKCVPLATDQTKNL